MELFCREALKGTEVRSRYNSRIFQPMRVLRTRPGQKEPCSRHCKYGWNGRGSFEKASKFCLSKSRKMCVHQTDDLMKLCYAESSLPLGSAVLKVLALGIPADDSELPATQHHQQSML